MEIVFPREFSIKISLGKEGAEPGTSWGIHRAWRPRTPKSFPGNSQIYGKTQLARRLRHPSDSGGSGPLPTFPPLSRELNFPGMNHCLELVKVSSPAAAGENLGFGVVSSQEP